MFRSTYHYGLFYLIEDKNNGRIHVYKAYTVLYFGCIAYVYTKRKLCYTSVVYVKAYTLLYFGLYTRIQSVHCVILWLYTLYINVENVNSDSVEMKKVKNKKNELRLE